MSEHTVTLFVESHCGWTSKPNVTGGYEIIDGNGWSLATLHYDYRFTCNATNHFRAKLFSGAPELLAALEAVKQSGANSARLRKQVYEDVVIGTAAWEMVLEALAKASLPTPEQTK